MSIFATACGAGPGPTTTLPRGILNFPQSAIDAQAGRIAGQSVSPAVCAGADHIGDSFPADSDVPYQWAPIQDGPLKNPYRPTIDEPQFIAGGQLTRWVPFATPTDPTGVRGDIMFAHPFGADYSWDMALNPASFLGLNYAPPGTGNNRPLHVEIEHGLFPYQDFGWGQPQKADSILVKGDWILDCGHSPATELHPPSFLAFGRAIDANTTIALAFASPYRTTQLYNPNEKVASAFSNFGRFTDPNTKPFPDHLTDEVNNVVNPCCFSQNLEAHVLIDQAIFGTVTWEVCAPSRKPADATLDYTYNFTARTGVAIQAVPDPARGCVKFFAVQGGSSGSYQPLPETPNHVTWSWADIYEAAKEQAGHPVDIKKMIYDKLCHEHGLCVHYYKGIENDPIIDRYPDQHPLVGADADSPIMISTADSQPFPFYGRVRVSWKVGAPPASSLVAHPAQLAWDNGPLAPKTVAIFNQGGSPAIQLGTVTIQGNAAADYTLTADSCSGASLPANAGCQITVTFTPKGTGSRDAAVIVTDNGGVRRLTIPLTGPGLIGFGQGPNELDSS